MQFLSHDKRQEISCHNVSLQEKKKAYEYWLWFVCFFLRGWDILIQD